MLLSEQKEDFVRDGYVVVPGLVPHEIVERTRTRLLQDLGADPQDPGTWKSKHETAKWAWSAGPMTTEVRSREVEEVVADLVGPRFLKQLSFHYGKETVGLDAREEGFIPVITYPKNPEGRRGFVEPAGWHLAGMYGSALAPVVLMLVIFVYLSDVAEDGGAMTVKPGSHRQVFEHWTKNKVDENTTGSLDDIPFAPSKPIAGKAGDVIFFHYLLMHSASENFDRHIQVGLNTCVHQEVGRPYVMRVGAPDETWTPFDRTLRTDNISGVVQDEPVFASV